MVDAAENRVMRAAEGGCCDALHGCKIQKNIRFRIYQNDLPCRVNRNGFSPVMYDISYIPMLIKPVLIKFRNTPRILQNTIQKFERL